MVARRANIYSTGINKKGLLTRIGFDPAVLRIALVLITDTWACAMVDALEERSVRPVNDKIKDWVGHIVSAGCCNSNIIRVPVGMFIWQQICEPGENEE